jgi:hypothetical protein
MSLVTLPNGATGLDFANGMKITADKPGATVEVSSRNARYLKNSWYGQTGVITGTGFSFGTKGTRRCVPCGRNWNSWSVCCPRCGSDTVAEAAEEAEHPV